MARDEDDIGRHEYTSPDEKSGRYIDSMTKHEKMTSDIQSERGGKSTPRLSHGQRQWLARLGALTGGIGGLFAAGTVYMEAFDEDEKGLLDFRGPDEDIVEAFYDIIDEESTSMIYSEVEALSDYSGELVQHASDPENMQYVVEALEAGRKLL